MNSIKQESNGKTPRSLIHGKRWSTILGHHVTSISRCFGALHNGSRFLELKQEKESSKKLGTMTNSIGPNMQQISSLDKLFVGLK